MLKACVLTATVLTLGAEPALAESSQSSQSSHPSPSSNPAGAQSQAPSAAQTGAPASAVVAAPAVGVVVDPDTRTAVVVPVNPQSDVPPEVTAMLKALTAEGKVRPGQIVQIVVRHGNQITQVISNAPVP